MSSSEQNFFKENNFRKRWMITKKLKISERQGNSTNKKSIEDNRSSKIAGSDAAPTLKFQKYIFDVNFLSLKVNFIFGDFFVTKQAKEIILYYILIFLLI